MADSRPPTPAVVVQEPSADVAPGDLVRHRGRVVKVLAVWKRVDEEYAERLYLELNQSGRPLMVRVR